MGQGRLTIEEYAQRRAELAKARSLLFDEGRRRQRLNKIKSKTYRSIRKRQISRRAENGGGSDDDGADEAAAREKAEADRAQEHVAVGKEGAPPGETQRQGHANSDGESGDGSDGDNRNYREEILALDRDGDDAPGDEGGGRGAAIFKLDFMKRGAERARERAREEAAEELRDFRRRGQTPEMKMDAAAVN